MPPLLRIILFCTLATAVIAVLVYVANQYHSPTRDAIADQSRPQFSSSQPATVPSTAATIASPAGK